nr:hypothetical protein [Tanacetum cinerariifolium]
MSSSTHPIILYDSDVEDAFSLTSIPNYTLSSPKLFHSFTRKHFFDTSEDPSKDQLVPIAVSPFHDDPYMKVILEIELEEARTQIAGLQKKQIGHDDEVFLARVRISTLEIIIKDIQVRHRSDIRSLLDAIRFLEPLYPNIVNVVHNQDIEHMIPPTSPRDNETPIGSPMPLSPSSSVGSSSPVKSTRPPPDYPFDESVFAELDNSLWIIPQPLESEAISKESNEMALKRTSTSAAPAMTQAAIRKLVADSVATALEA